MNGSVVGYKGSKLFIFNQNIMSTLDVSQTPTLLKFIEKKDFKNAYKVAIIGSTD